MAEWLWLSFTGRIALSCGLFAAGALAWRLWPEKWTLRRQWMLLFTLAIAARAFVWALPPSDDVNRYLWEGRLIRSGISPYAQTADSLASMRDDAWDAMNHRDKFTVYPPLAELSFAVLGGIAYAPWIYKLAFTLADLAALPLLAALGGRARWLALYTVNPVVVLSFAGEAHFDSLMVVSTVAAVLFAQRQRPALAWTALGMAVQFKLVAILLVPAFWMHFEARGRRASWAFALAAALPVLPFVASAPQWIGGLADFGGTTSGNGSLHFLLELVCGGKATPSAICAVVLFVSTLWIARKVQPLGRAALWTCFAFLLCAPTVTFWYATWVLPFAVLHRSRAAWVLSALSILYYAAWQHRAQTGEWLHPIWAQAALWVPVIWFLYRDTRLTIINAPLGRTSGDRDSGKISAL